MVWKFDGCPSGGETMMKIIVLNGVDEPSEPYVNPNLVMSDLTNQDYTVGSVDEADEGVDETENLSPTQTHDSDGATDFIEQHKNKRIEKEYLIHEALLKKISPYFVAMNNFREASEKVIVLRDVSPEVFHIFANWLYTGTRDWEHAPHYNLNTQLAAYCLGRRLIMPKFQDFIIDEIRMFDSDGLITVSKLLELCDLGFTASDPITQYFIDRIAYRAAMTEFWSFDFPMTASEEKGETLAEWDNGVVLLSLTRRLVHLIREIQPYTQSSSPREDPFDPRSDTAKSYHILTDKEADASAN